MKTLKPEVAAKYCLVGIRPGKYNFKGFGEINLAELNIAKADSLFQRGFPHLKLRQGSVPEIPVKPETLGIRPIATGKPKQPADSFNPHELRKNKQYVNKLLTMDWSNLSHQDKEVFFNDQAYFLSKKKSFLEISETDRRMKSLHAKAKTLKDQQKLQATMTELSELDEKKLTMWLSIDTWTAPESDHQKIASEAVKTAAEKDRMIKNNKIYIFRAENSLPNMPAKTAQQKERKAHKLSEIDKRKKKLIELGAPYEGKSS